MLFDYSGILCVSFPFLIVILLTREIYLMRSAHLLLIKRNEFFQRLYFKWKYLQSPCFLHVVHRQRAGPPRARVGINRCWFMTPRQSRGHRHRFRCNLDNRNRFDNPENLNARR